MIKLKTTALITSLLLTACSNDSESNLQERMKAVRENADQISATNKANAIEKNEAEKIEQKELNSNKEELKSKTAKEEKIVDPYEDVRHLIEKDANLDERLTEKNILGIIGLIVGNGYKCDSVSAITPFPRKTGFYVMCNQYHYDYEVADKGGNWVVTLN